jgi:glycosyltransferase involved in cell wall biosynthesis
MHNSGPMITTIIPTYRRPALLRRAIKSVLLQTYPNFRVCVYDNASGDETASVVNEIALQDNRIQYYCHSENIGAFDNFQFGLQHIDTEFFSLLSDDDVLCPEFYRTAVKRFDEHPEAGFVSMSVLNANTWGDIFPDGAMSDCHTGLYKPFDGLVTMLLNTPPTWTGTLFKKSVVDEIGLLDKDAGFASDMDFVLRAAARFPFVYDNAPGGIFVPAPLANTNSLRGSVEDILPGFRKIIDNLTYDDRMPEKMCRQIESILRASMRVRLLQMGIVSILRSDYNGGFKASQLLHCHFPESVYGKLLSVMVRMFQCIPLLRSFLLRLYRFRGNMYRFKQMYSGGRYTKFSSLLKD